MVSRRTDELQPHPANERIYGDGADDALLESVRAHGVLNPLLITSANVIIAGHRRWYAAQRVGRVIVPVAVFGSEDEQEILEALVESNRQRVKNGAMLAREAATLAEIERVRAKQRQQAALAQFKADRSTAPVQAPVPERRQARDEVARKLDISPRTAQHAINVGQELQRLENSPQPADRARAAELSKVAAERGLRPAAALVQKPSVNGVKAPVAVVEALPGVAVPTFNRTNEKVDWAWWTWNPVTGCLHDCDYCYARDIANRFYPQGFTPTFHADRIRAPRNTRVPAGEEPQRKRVFTCSMADLFGKWVPQEWIDAVFAEVRDNPQWEFLFLTKFPQRLASLEWPDNAWVGTTVDRQYRVEIAEKAFRGVKAGVKWLSCEPLMEPLRFSSLGMFDWVVIGGASASSRTPEFWPPVEWIIDLHNQARAAGCKVYYKPNAIGNRTPVPKEQPRSEGSR